jgi:5-methylcytosine-specific restriction protein A
MCQESGITEPATVADHVIPHKGEWFLFFDAGNLQSLCKRCHDSVKQQSEKIGFSQQIDEDGWPMDQRHPVNQQA